MAAPLSLLLSLLALLASVRPAAAAFPQRQLAVYTIVGMAVDAVGENNSAAARALAFENGKRAAFAKLLDRLTLSPPDLMPDDSQLDSMTLSLSVEHEHILSDRYVGEITVTFLPSAVRAWMDEYGLAYNDSPGHPVVVLPVYQASSGEPPDLWSDGNQWRQAWARRPSSGITPVRVPLGDVSDISAIDARRAINMDAEALRIITAAYSVDTALVAAARFETTPAVVADNQAPGPPTTDTRRLLVTAQLSTPDSQIYEAAYDLPPTAEPESLFPPAIADLMAWVGRQTRFATAADTARRGTVLVTAPLEQSLKDWLHIRAALTADRRIATWRLRALSIEQAQLAITYRGAVSGLVKSLARSGLSLRRQSHGAWVLRRTEADMPTAPPTSLAEWWWSRPHAVGEGHAEPSTKSLMDGVGNSLTASEATEPTVLPTHPTAPRPVAVPMLQEIPQP